MAAGTMVGLFSLLVLPLALAQDSGADGTGTRQLWDQNLQRLRPKSPRKPAPVRKPQPAAPKPEPADDSFVGLTLWQLRPSTGADQPGTRLLVQEEETGTRQEFTPERVEANTVLPEGAKIRVSIEAARAGYLYVVDREQYADGSYSDPYLIFPTTQLRGGMNEVGPGIVIEVPDPEDKVPYFRLRRNRARSAAGGATGSEQVSEVLTVLISPKPIPGLRIGRTAQKLRADQFAAWEKEWATQTKVLEASDQAGKAYTEAEKRAGQEGIPLTADDPLPQTLIQTSAKSGDPLLVTIPIRIAKPASR